MVVTFRQHLQIDDFSHRLSSLESRMEKDYLQYWQVHAPHYTDHGKPHCKAVEMNLDELVPDEVKNYLNEYEVFLLLASVWLHDIGIMCATKIEEDDQSIRSSHHERSSNFILNNFKDLFNPQERNILSEVCFAHRDIVPMEKLTLEKTLRHETLGNKLIHIQFIAALLRLADSCDLCHTRTSEDLLEISKPPEEASFHHSLHERVSGVDFDSDNKTIYLHIDIVHNKEKSLLQQYLIDKLQLSLDSVRDVLVRNGLFYFEVIPKFHIVKSATRLSRPPEIATDASSKAQLLRHRNRISKIFRKARRLYTSGDFKGSIEAYDKLLKITPDSALIWLLKSESLIEAGDLDMAADCIEKSLKIDSKNSSTLGSAAHFFGEYLLDVNRSFELTEKAFQVSPNITSALNYAEALITVNKPAEAYRIATKYWEKTNEVDKLLNAQFIRAYSLLFGRSKKVRAKGLIELRRLVDFFKLLPSSFKDVNRWVYNKIRHHVENSKLEKSAKELIIATIDLIRYQISSEDFEKDFGKMLPR